MINFKKIIFILLIISSALATKNAFSASKVVGIAKALGKLGKRGKPGDDAPAGIAAPKPNVLALPTTEEELEILERCSLDLATPDKAREGNPSDPFETSDLFKTEEEQEAAKRPAKAGSRAEMPDDKLAALRKKQAAACAAYRAKRTLQQQAEYNQRRAAKSAARIAKMPIGERKKYNAAKVAVQRAYRARKKDKEAKEAAV